MLPWGLHRIPPVPYAVPPRCPDWIHTSDLSDVEKLIWLTIRGVQGKNEKAWASRQHYAKISGKTPSQVSLATKKMLAAGWLEVVGKRGRDAEYRCHAPESQMSLRHSENVSQTPKEESRMSVGHRPMSVGHSENVSQTFPPTPPYKEEPVKESVQEPAQPRKARTGAGGPDRFEDWWRVYPKKRGKKPARDKWKAKKLNARADDLIADVERRKTEDDRWQRGFAPDPLTYLNQERWTDELSDPKPKTHRERHEHALNNPSESHRLKLVASRAALGADGG